MSNPYNGSFEPPYNGTIDPRRCLVHGLTRQLRLTAPALQTTLRLTAPALESTATAISWWECPLCVTENGAVPQPWTWVGQSTTASFVEGLESLVPAAKAAGVVLYDDPRTLNYETLEEQMRGPCSRINASGWCFTAESCHGHVHETTRIGGSWGDHPFIRLTTRQQHFGHMLDLMSRAMTFEEPDLHAPVSDPRTLTFWVFRDTRGEPDFSSAIIRIPTYRVYDRITALDAFARFGELVNTDYLGGFIVPLS